MAAKKKSRETAGNEGKPGSKGVRRAKGFAWLKWLLVVLGIGLAYDVLTGPSGLLHLRSLAKENADKQQELDSLVQFRHTLERQKVRLLTDSSYMEAMARKELGMAKPGEKIYRYQP